MDFHLFTCLFSPGCESTRHLRWGCWTRPSINNKISLGQRTCNVTGPTIGSGSKPGSRSSSNRNINIIRPTNLKTPMFHINTHIWSASWLVKVLCTHTSQHPLYHCTKDFEGRCNGVLQQTTGSNQGHNKTKCHWRHVEGSVLLKNLTWQFKGVTLMFSGMFIAVCNARKMSEHPMCLQWRRRLANQRKRLTNLWIAEPRRKGTKETSFLRVPVRKSIRSIKSITTQCNSWNSITWQPSHRQTRLPTPARTGPIKMAKAMEQGWALRIDLENQIRKHRKVLMELLWPHQICNLCRWPSKGWHTHQLPPQQPLMPELTPGCPPAVPLRKRPLLVPMALSRTSLPLEGSARSFFHYLINHPAIGVSPWLWKPPYVFSHGFSIVMEQMTGIGPLSRSRH